MNQPSRLFSCKAKIAFLHALLLMGGGASVAWGADSSRLLPPVESGTALVEAEENAFDAALKFLEGASDAERKSFFKERLELVLAGRADSQGSSADELAALVGYLEARALDGETLAAIARDIWRRDRAHKWRERLIVLGLGVVACGGMLGSALFGHYVDGGAVVASGCLVAAEAMDVKSTKALEQIEKLRSRLKDADRAGALLRQFDRAFLEVMQQVLPASDRQEFLETFFFDRSLAAAAHPKGLLEEESGRVSSCEDALTRPGPIRR